MPPYPPNRAAQFWTTTIGFWTARCFRYAQLRSLHLAQRIGANNAIEIGYSGNYALGGDRGVNAHDAPPGPGAIQPRRRFPQYGVITKVRSDAKTFYDAGTLKFTRRFSDGITILSSYTFSRSLDQSFSSVAGNPTGGAVSQTYLNLSQRGLSASHRQHVWTTSAVWELPFGKGRAFLNQGGGARVNTGSDQRPNRLRDANLPSSERSITRWFDTSAYVAAPMFTFGTEETRTLIMPGLANVDVNLKKAFALREGINLKLSGPAAPWPT